MSSTMLRYRDISGESGVVAYLSGDDYIVLRFRGHGTYLYDAVRPGRAHVEAMKRLARAGRGLSTYVSRYVRGSYAAKLDD